MVDLTKLIGKKVKGVIDRPLSSHHPIYKDMIYQVNYGYIPGLIGGDNEPQDAYFLGVAVPVDEFEGVVIAVVHRLNDVEDKLVVAPNGIKFSKEEIEKLIYFQEQYFEHVIIM